MDLSLKVLLNEIAAASTKMPSHKMNADVRRHADLLRRTLLQDYELIFREPGDPFAYGFLAPATKCYSDQLWDWDSWWTNVALRQILLEKNDAAASTRAGDYERGSILNFLSWTGYDGWMPIVVSRGANVQALRPDDYLARNMHKPCLAQHAAFLVGGDGGDAEWLREKFHFLQAFINNYRFHHRNESCGLYYWQNDFAIGVDNDPATLYRPPKSSGSIYLNCLMLRELEAMVYLCHRLKLDGVAAEYRRDAADLKEAVMEHCWDERDGFFYSVDLNLLPVEHLPVTSWETVLKEGQGNGLNQGGPRDYHCLIQRLGVWSGFMALWAGVATPEQAERVVAGHYRNKETFNAPFGVRTLSRMEKMYSLRGTNNPSNWRGPIWGISNYLTWRGLVRYGFESDARELAAKTITLFGRDMERFGELHENYQPENGEPIMNRGFQDWNYLVLIMIAWMEGRETVEEFSGA